MKKLTFLIGFNLLALTLMAQKVGINTNAPQQALDVHGKLKVGNDTTTSSPGTMRFNPDTGDFEGFDGNDWVPFTPDPRDSYWPQPGFWEYWKSYTI
ncbi:MAG: hypothetical protein IPO92_04500 [Saprospiraceae bacterium]|nr:hypothetical protein [Saprospiraceae bacterium]